MKYRNLKLVSALSVITSMGMFFMPSSVLAEKYSIGTTSFPTYTLNKKAPQVEPPIKCSISFGDKSHSPEFRLKNNKVTKINEIGGPWNFIYHTAGPCSFTIYNKNNFKGRRVNYGSGVLDIRVATTATDNSSGGGWKARSVVITPHKKPACQITLAGTYTYGLKVPIGYLNNRHRTTQTFYGPSRVGDITAWSLVSKTSGNRNCKYTLYNEKNLTGRMTVLKKVDKDMRVGWKIRSIEISQR